MNSRMVPGVKVQLSGRFLRSTGQGLGGEGQSIWTVLECPCRSCESGYLVAVDQERSDLDKLFTEHELISKPHLKWRHIARSNLVIYGEPSIRNCP